MVGNYDFRAEAHTAQTFQRYVDDLMQALPEHTLLFMIDEYELLEAKVEDSSLSGESITFFAGVLERHSQISFVFTGSRNLEERTVPFWKVLLGKSIARHVSFLSESDTYRLVQDPVKVKRNA